MSRKAVFIGIATAMLLVTLTAGAAVAARPVFVFQTLMTGEAEVPGPGDPHAVGHATIMVRPQTDEICWVLSWNRVDGTVVAAHIHGPTDVSDPAPPVVPIFMGEPHESTDTDRGCTTSSWADEIVADPSLFYVNVHALPQFGPGAIRGQLD